MDNIQMLGGGGGAVGGGEGCGGGGGGGGAVAPVLKHLWYWHSEFMSFSLSSNKRENVTWIPLLQSNIRNVKDGYRYIESIGFKEKHNMWYREYKGGCITCNTYTCTIYNARVITISTFLQSVITERTLSSLLPQGVIMYDTCDLVIISFCINTE